MNKTCSRGRSPYSRDRETQRDVQDGTSKRVQRHKAMTNTSLGRRATEVPQGEARQDTGVWPAPANERAPVLGAAWSHDSIGSGLRRTPGRWLQRRLRRAPSRLRAGSAPPASLTWDPSPRGGPPCPWRRVRAPASVARGLLGDVSNGHHHPTRRAAVGDPILPKRMWHRPAPCRSDEARPALACTPLACAARGAA